MHFWKNLDKVKNRSKKKIGRKNASRQPALYPREKSLEKSYPTIILENIKTGSPTACDDCASVGRNEWPPPAAAARHWQSPPAGTGGHRKSAGADSMPVPTQAPLPTPRHCSTAVTVSDSQHSLPCSAPDRSAIHLFRSVASVGNQMRGQRGTARVFAKSVRQQSAAVSSASVDLLKALNGAAKTCGSVVAARAYEYSGSSSASTHTTVRRIKCQ